MAFSIVLKNDDVNKCKNYFLKNSIDIVGYGMINNKEKAFERFKRQNLIVVEKFMKTHFFYPYMTVWEMKKQKSLKFLIHMLEIQQDEI